MNEKGNVSLIEVVFAAFIIFGTVAFASTMEPPVQSLVLPTNQNIAASTTLDALILKLGFPGEYWADELWDKSASSFDEELQSELDQLGIGASSVYLNTGSGRILLFGEGGVGAVGARTILLHWPVSIESNQAEAGNSVQDENVFDNLFPPGLGQGNICSLSFIDGVGTARESENPDGESWLDVWDAALAEGHYPAEVPYGQWGAQREHPILPFVCVGNVETITLGPPGGIQSTTDFSVYKLELVIP